MRRTSVSDGITYVEPSSMSNFQSCAGVIIASAGQKLLIDTNMGPDETPLLLRAEQPDVAVISHYHVDHSAWAASVLDHTDAELSIPEGEEIYLTNRDFFIEKTAGPYGLTREWKEFVFNVTGYRLIDWFTTYGDGTRFIVGNISVECVRTPGHSPAHSAFYFPDEKILFTGDMGIDRFGPWYGWADCDIRALAESMLRLRSLKVNLMLTGHGGIVASGIREAWDRSLRQLVKREKTIAEQLAQGAEKSDIVEKGVFFSDKSGVKEPMRSFLFMWDSIMFDHHKAMLDQGGLSAFFPELG